MNERKELTMASFLLNKLTPGCVAGEENGVLGPSEDTGFVGTELSLNYASVLARTLVDVDRGKEANTVDFGP
jgi:hypothetical protein